MKNRQGQSIVELIVAMAVGVILLVGGVAAIVPMLKASKNVAQIQAASALGKELFENVRVLAEADWHALDGLSTSSAGRYYIIASTSPFAVATGTESVVVSTTTYDRFFYLDDVYRNPTAPFEPGGSAYDPSTKRITVVYVWPTNASDTITGYLTRAVDDVLWNNNWTAGGNQSGPVTATSTNDSFATSSNIDYVGTPGSIVITGF
jgi:type II secretory pathway pseudopilin PulG